MELTGFGVGTKVAVGTVVRMPDPLPEPDANARVDGDLDAERQRALAALSEVARDLQARAAELDGPARDVVEASAMMAADPSLADAVAERTAIGKTAERAVFEAFESFRATLRSMGGYMAERATDLGDVSQRVVARLLGVPAPEVPHSDEPFILVAHDLAPADTAKLDLSKVLALVTRDGSPKAHTGILAAEKGLPAVVAVNGADRIADGATVIVEAGSGAVFVNPTQQQLANAKREIDRQAALAAAPIEPGALADGTRIQVLANVGKPGDGPRAVQLGAEGVGLFRTEFLFLDSDDAPSVAKQIADYTELLTHFSGMKVVARVLDAGADKPLAFLTDSDEPNPALGLRGIRVLKSREQVLRDQLTALAAAQAATGAELWVMAPMVAEASESEYFTSLARELGIQVAGSMIEVPSAAILAEQVLQSSDFISIGTNDLTQYTLAADRVLGSVAGFQDPWHPAVLRLIKIAGDAGEATGKSVGVCGEAAADPRLAVVLVGLGVRSLSMAPPAFAEVRAALRRVTLERAREVAAAVLQATSAAAAREIGAELLAAR
ncbi:phosphoenolpyruvate-protein phosphotransferase [Pseudoclavibacter endophyticus]|uniref:Phosphoenolpyruvate-protein phosphotransferase n=1 Tax=Pseudoclavibacter endophyticus TaxID=1778590 RepID=A0A6H9WBX7_9MICO|nr:phosphoenolpyruvate--protein phosphotransferase [Pseudoclavibacter endophyticus]KAB1648173.1 phosphoenolpyruvate--protein phosphotransferase [Pseudoclavibacter endophyticus]GGA70331.1 phosphoenolpyruvate-protein phosphotransferase [Pseudoclavibacter endophyticus]